MKAQSKNYVSYTTEINVARALGKVTGTWNLGQLHQVIVQCTCLKSMSRTITVQGLTLAVITTIDKGTLMLDSM